MPEETKKVLLNYAALTRVEYSEVAEVPADFNDNDIEQLMLDRAEALDGSEYVDDNEYWEEIQGSFDKVGFEDFEPSILVNADGEYSQVESTHKAPLTLVIDLQDNNDLMPESEVLVIDDIRQVMERVEKLQGVLAEYDIESANINATLEYGLEVTSSYLCFKLDRNDVTLSSEGFEISDLKEMIAIAESLGKDSVNLVDTNISNWITSQRVEGYSISGLFAQREPGQ